MLNDEYRGGQEHGNLDLKIDGSSGDPYIAAPYMDATAFNIVFDPCKSLLNSVCINDHGEI